MKVNQLQNIPNGMMHLKNIILRKRVQIQKNTFLYNFTYIKFKVEVGGTCDIKDPDSGFL